MRFDLLPKVEFREITLVGVAKTTGIAILVMLVFLGAKIAMLYVKWRRADRLMRKQGYPYFPIDKRWPAWMGRLFEARENFTRIYDWRLSDYKRFGEKELTIGLPVSRARRASPFSSSPPRADPPFSFLTL